MSRSNNTELRNPAERFFRWDGDKGGFKYYDKNLGENGQNVKIDLPFRFLVLDALSTITGYDDDTKSGYWSNEVRDIRNEQFVVRTQKGICYKGLYDQMSLTGAKYAQSVYIAYAEGGGWHIGNIKFSGASIGSWIDFRKKNKIFDGMICVNEMLHGQKGRVEYEMPVFSKVEADADMNDVAIELDKELQKYLDQYFLVKKKEETDNASTAVATAQEPMHDEPPPMESADDEASPLPF